MRKLFLIPMLIAQLCNAQPPPPTLPPAQATIDSIAQDEKFLLGVFNDHFHPGSAAQIYTKAQLDSLADKVLARNTTRRQRLSDIWISEYVPPTPIPCLCVVDSWGPCIGGTQTAVVRGIPMGCTPPCPPQTRTCTMPATSAIPAASVLVLYDQGEAGSQGRAELYASTWGIPAANVKSVNVGNTDDLSTGSIVDLRATINGTPGVQWCVLAWDTPSRAGYMSITAALTFGMLSQYSSLGGALPTSALYQYTGTTPKTDKGLVPCFQLHSMVNFVERSSKANAPKGVVYMHAANDGAGTPRGSSRVAQFQALHPRVGFTFTDNRTGCPGACDGNQVLGKSDMLSYFNGHYLCTGMETNTVLPGAFGDYVTSTSGNLPTGQGQTPITYLLQNGFAGCGGTVVEPWQSGGSGASPGWLVEQFVNAQLFTTSYFDNSRSLGQSVWSSVKCPGRYLILGDPMCTPKGVPTDPPAPPVAGLVFATTFAGTGPGLVATTGNTIQPSASWSGGTFNNGTITTTGNTSYPWTGTATKVVLQGYTPTGTGAFNYSRITSVHTIRPGGLVVATNDGKPDVSTGITLVKGTKYATLELPVPAGYTLLTVVGGKFSTGSTQIATCEGLEVWR